MPATTVRGADVLVTGASGFLGSHLCDRLLADGARVHATSRAARTSDHPRLSWRQTDLSDDRSVLAMMREIAPDVVFHLAGQVSAAPDFALNLPAFHSLLGSTVHLLTAATEIGCRRVVVTGSLTEPHSGEIVPSSPYAAAKWASSAYSRMFHKLYATPVVILRPFMTYGPRQSAEKLIPHVIRSLLRGTSPKLASGRWRADWIYVDDVIEGFVLAACRSEIDGETIDLGSGELTSTHDVVRKLALRIASAVEPQFGAVPDRPGEALRTADVARAKALLGWEARTSLDQGLDRTVAWYRDQLERPNPAS